MRLSFTQRATLFVTITLAITTVALSASAYRTYSNTTPTSATVIKVDTQTTLRANPITEYDLLKPEAVEKFSLHSIYLAIPGVSDTHGDGVLSSIDLQPPAVGSSMRVRYRTSHGTLEVFPEDLVSLLGPAIFSAILTVCVGFLLTLMTAEKGKD